MAYPNYQVPQNAYQIAGQAVQQGAGVLDQMNALIEKRRQNLIAQRQAEIEAQREAELRKREDEKYQMEQEQLKRQQDFRSKIGAGVQGRAQGPATQSGEYPTFRERDFTPQEVIQEAMTSEAYDPLQLAQSQLRPEANLPANLQIHEAVKNMDPQERQLYYQTVRSSQYLDLGTHRLNPLTDERYDKEVPLQDLPFFKQLVAEATETGKMGAQIKLKPELDLAISNMKKIPGAKKVVTVVNTLRDKYEKLRKLRGVVDLDAGWLSNLITSGTRSTIGQTFQRWIGTDAQSLRDEIKTLRTWGLLAIKDAADLGTTSMNTAAEMKIFLDVATDPDASFQANTENLNVFEKTYGKVLQTPPGTHKNNMDEYDYFIANYKPGKTQPPDASPLTPQQNPKSESMRGKYGY